MGENRSDVSACGRGRGPALERVREREREREREGLRFVRYVTGHQ